MSFLLVPDQAASSSCSPGSRAWRDDGQMGELAARRRCRRAGVARAGSCIGSRSSTRRPAWPARPRRAARVGRALRAEPAEIRRPAVPSDRAQVWLGGRMAEARGRPAGGASMFTVSSNALEVGQRNEAAVRELRAQRIPACARDRRQPGRTIRVYLADMRVTVRVAGGKDSICWSRPALAGRRERTGSPRRDRSAVDAARDGRCPTRRRRRSGAGACGGRLTRPTKFTADQERRLRRTLEAFCRTASTRISAGLRVPLELELLTSTQLTWANAHAQVRRSRWPRSSSASRSTRACCWSREQPRARRDRAVARRARQARRQGPSHDRHRQRSAALLRALSRS